MLGKEDLLAIMKELGFTEEHTDDAYNNTHFYGNDKWLAKFDIEVSKALARLHGIPIQE